MPLNNFSQTLIQEKNKLSSTYPWLILLDISIPSTPASIIYLVRNTDDIVFNGQTYIAFPFTIDATKQNATGQIPTVTLQVSNVTRALQVYLEAYKGLVGQSIIMRVVNANYLTENYVDLTFTFEILDCTSTVEWVSFTLGSTSSLTRRFPLYIYLAGMCRYAVYFKGVECKAKAGSVVLFNTTPTAGGTGYTKGDILYLSSGGGTGARVRVDSVSSGIVTTLVAKPIIPGYGYSIASGLTVTGGTGSGCKVAISSILPSVCDGLLATCQLFGNERNYGGFPGLQAGGLRIV